MEGIIGKIGENIMVFGLGAILIIGVYLIFISFNYYKRIINKDKFRGFAVIILSFLPIQMTCFANLFVKQYAKGLGFKPENCILILINNNITIIIGMVVIIMIKWLLHKYYRKNDGRITDMTNEIDINHDNSDNSKNETTSKLDPIIKSIQINMDRFKKYNSASCVIIIFGMIIIRNIEETVIWILVLVGGWLWFDSIGNHDVEIIKASKVRDKITIKSIMRKLKRYSQNRSYKLSPIDRGAIIILFFCYCGELFLFNFGIDVIYYLVMGMSFGLFLAGIGTILIAILLKAQN